MRNVTLIMAAAFAAMIATPVAAQDGPRLYVGGQFELVNLDDFDIDGSPNLFGDNTSAFSVRGGVVVHTYVAIEAEYAQGLDNEAEDGVAGYDNRFGGFIRPRLPVDDSGFEVFARLGYATTAIDSQAVNGLEDLGGFAFGLGAAYSFGKRDRIVLRADWTKFTFGGEDNLGTGDGLGANAFGVGIGYTF